MKTINRIIDFLLSCVFYALVLWGLAASIGAFFGVGVWAMTETLKLLGVL